MISSHSWGDSTSLGRILRLGGMVGPYAGSTEDFKAYWREARAKRDPRFFFGVGFGSDINGLGAQGPPRPDAAANPVRYPFRTFDGGTRDGRQTSGSRVYDINADGVDHYGLYPDWVEDLRVHRRPADRGGPGQRRGGLPADVGARRGGGKPHRLRRPARTSGRSGARAAR